MNAVSGAFTARSIAAVLSVLAALFIVSVLISHCSGTPVPDFQSVSGEFARNWLDEHKEPGREINEPDPITVIPPDENAGSEGGLWSWGGAPRGNQIVDGELVSDPLYLQPKFNLSRSWLDEKYSDSDSGFPVNTYLDPHSGKRYYQYINPTTGEPIFSYYIYHDDLTGQTIYVYKDPITGDELQTTSKPTDVINSLGSGLFGWAF